MNIGKERRTITVEPVRKTTPAPRRQPVPRKEPAPTKPVRTPEKVPAR